MNELVNIFGQIGNTQSFDETSVSPSPRPRAYPVLVVR